MVRGTLSIFEEIDHRNTILEEREIRLYCIQKND